MKNFLALTILATSLLTSSANALVVGTAEGRGDCMPGHPNYRVCVATFVLSSSTSLPTLLAGADFSEMSQADRQEYVAAEAQNFVEGVQGEYLLLKLAARELNVSVEELAVTISSGN